MLRTIKLYGALGKKFGRTHNLYVNSVGEAVRLLCANYKEFRQYLQTDNNRVGYEVWDGKRNLGKDDKEEFSQHGDSDIKIIPRIIGAGNVAKIITGAVLLAVSFFVPGTQGTALAYLSQAAGMLGTSLILSGVLGMMTKTASGVSVESTEDNTQSYVFSGTLNTTKQGNPVFIAYGTHLLGSQVVSASLTTSEVPV